MEQVFSYVISFGASVMMPIIFTVIGLCIGMKFGKALKSGLFVGVGFVGLGIVTALLPSPCILTNKSIIGRLFFILVFKVYLLFYFRIIPYYIQLPIKDISQCRYHLLSELR